MLPAIVHIHKKHNITQTHLLNGGSLVRHVWHPRHNSGEPEICILLIRLFRFIHLALKGGNIGCKRPHTRSHRVQIVRELRSTRVQIDTVVVVRDDGIK